MKYLRLRYTNSINAVKDLIMLAVLSKFSKDDYLKVYLYQQTLNLLVENAGQSSYWGNGVKDNDNVHLSQKYENKQLSGQNKLGQILMDVSSIIYSKNVNLLLMKITYMVKAISIINGYYNQIQLMDPYSYAIGGRLCAYCKVNPAWKNEPYCSEGCFFSANSQKSSTIPIKDQHIFLDMAKQGDWERVKKLLTINPGLINVTPKVVGLFTSCRKSLVKLKWLNIYACRC